MGIEIVARPVYRAPTARRCFLTKRAAADAEAAALIKRKYPTERPSYDDRGQMYDSGWHFTSDERLVRLHKRVTRMLLRQLRLCPPTPDLDRA